MARDYTIIDEAADGSLSWVRMRHFDDGRSLLLAYGHGWPCAADPDLDTELECFAESDTVMEV